MDITLTVILVCFVVFFIAGFVDAIAGGGGLITMPVLLLLAYPLTTRSEPESSLPASVQLRH